MLSTEVSMLRQEVIDFRTRVDGLVEEVASLKNRERFLNETLDSTVSISVEVFAIVFFFAQILIRSPFKGHFL